MPSDNEKYKEYGELRERLHMRESELEHYREQIKREQYESQKKLEKELREREEHFSNRESVLAKRQKEYEKELLKQEQRNHELHQKLTNQIREKEQVLAQALDELEREKSRYEKESRDKIESTSQNYVSDALALLEAKEVDFHKKSRYWAISGATSIGLGLLFFIALSVYSTIYPPEIISWQNIALYLTKGLVVVGLFAALSKYAHGYSAAYMHESLKNADRRHAINFGKFYLEAYGASAEWSEVKQAFEHWNISEKNAFSKSEKNPLESKINSKKATNEELNDLFETIKKIVKNKSV